MSAFDHFVGLASNWLTLNRAGKIRFSGARKSLLLKPSLEELCAPRNFVLLDIFLRYMCSPHHIPCCAPNEISYGKIGYGQMKQCNNILPFPHVRAERLSEKRKP